MSIPLIATVIAITAFTKKCIVNCIDKKQKKLIKKINLIEGFLPDTEPVSINAIRRRSDGSYQFDEPTR